MARLVGANKNEVVIMNSLTANLHFMMISFYKPTVQRFKILIEKKSFPSDYHAVVSQIQLHGLDPATCLIEIAPREGEVTLSEDDIIDIINKEGECISLVLFSGVQYYTGQFFDLEKIIKAAKGRGCNVGLDLAHAVGNVPLSLHDWDCDFACWCTYKYMNSGPGCVGGCFIHEKHFNTFSTDDEVVTSSEIVETSKKSTEKDIENDIFLPLKPFRLTGWWGFRQADRFQMNCSQFMPCEGANGFRVSNAPILLIACVQASLDIFDKVFFLVDFLFFLKL
jgi:kynureninase